MQRAGDADKGSSLVVQLLLYYNVWFSAFYLVVGGAVMREKVTEFEFHSEFQEFLASPAFLIWVPAEAARLYLGYAGNLREQVPHMASFLLMTVFPQIPAVLFLGFLQEHVLPFDVVCGSVLLVFLLLQLAFGMGELQVLIRRQTATFFRVCEDEQAGLLDSSSSERS